MTRYRLASLDAMVAGPKYRLAAIDAMVASAAKYRLASIDARVGAGFAISMGTNPPQFNPFDVVTMSVSFDGTLAPETVTFLRLAEDGAVIPLTGDTRPGATPSDLIPISPDGFTTGLGGSGSTRFFKMPGRVFAVKRRFRAVATKTGYPDAVAELSMQCGPHAGPFSSTGIGWELHV